MYYSKTGDDMIIVTYIYGENPIHSLEVAVVVGSINLEWRFEKWVFILKLMYRSNLGNRIVELYNF